MAVTHQILSNVITSAYILLMNITNTTVLDNVTEIIAVASTEQPAESGLPWLYIVAGIVVLVVLYAFKGGKASNAKKEIALVGQRGAGKTQLLISLCGGKVFQTVPSINNNASELELGGKSFRVIDFIGDNVSRQEVVSEIARFKAIVQVVDGTDSRKLSDAALFLYRVLISKSYQKDPCPLILYFSKVDLQSFHGEQKLAKRIEDEIETIKLSRRNQAEDNENEEDLLKVQRAAFTLRQQGVEVVSGSSQQGQTALKGLLGKLEEACS